MFRCTFDELTETLLEEFPIPVPVEMEESDVNTLLAIMRTGMFGEQSAMGVTWNRLNIMITDTDKYRFPYRLGASLFDQDYQPEKISILRMRVGDSGRAMFGLIPEKVIPTNDNSYGKPRVKLAIWFRASNAVTATALTFIGSSLGRQWLDQFPK